LSTHINYVTSSRSHTFIHIHYSGAHMYITFVPTRIPKVIWDEPRCRPYGENAIGYNRMPQIYSQNCPLPFNDLDHHLIHASLDRSRSSLQMGFRSNQPCLW